MASLLVAAFGCRARPTPLGPMRERGTLRIDSFATEFNTAGRFDGRFTVLPDSVILELDSALVVRRDNSKGRTPLHLDSISVGLGWYPRSGSRQWDIGPRSRAIVVDRPFLTGDSARVGSVRVAVPRPPGADLRRRWLIVEIHETYRQPNQRGYTGSAFSYAHSARDLFVAR